MSWAEVLKDGEYFRLKKTRKHFYQTGFLLRQLQQGDKLQLPQSRPMPNIGKRCHELRINDENLIWRIIYRIDVDAIVILEVFDKKTKQTPKHVIDVCKDRIRVYDDESR